MLLLKLAPLNSDLGQPDSQFVFRSVVVCCEVVEVLLLAVEFGDSLADLISQQLRRGDLVVEHLMEPCSNSLAELATEPDRPVVPLHGVFDVIDLGVTTRAGASWLAATEEVEVFAAVAEGSLYEESALVAGAVALPAPDAAFEVVRVFP